MMLPHIFGAIKGKPNRLAHFIDVLDDEGTKARVMRVLTTYRVPFK